jgi:hypothetical protein
MDDSRIEVRSTDGTGIKHTWCAISNAHCEKPIFACINCDYYRKTVPNAGAMAKSEAEARERRTTYKAEKARRARQGKPTVVPGPVQECHLGAVRGACLHYPKKCYDWDCTIDCPELLAKSEAEGRAVVRRSQISDGLRQLFHRHWRG